MDAKADNPAIHLEGRRAPPVIRALFEICHLKQLYRRGWLERGLPRERCESVAEHSFGTAMLALLLAPQGGGGLDAGKLIRMALLHDAGEIRAGDATPADGIPRSERHDRERRSAVGVLSGLPAGAELIALWDEYAAGATAEARFIRQLDRMEMALQAAVYENQGLGDLSEFFAAAAGGVTNAELRGLLAEIEKLRPA